MANKDERYSFWISLSLLLIGGIFGGLVEELLDYRRELRENTQNFVATFNDVYFGAHRDNLHRLYVSSDMIEFTSGAYTRQEYAEWLRSKIVSDGTLSASVFAIAEFYRTLNFCSDEGRCRKHSIEQEFRPYAIVYYNTFYPVLRYADCDLRFPSMEAAVSRIAGFTEAPERRCNVIDPYK